MSSVTHEGKAQHELVEFPTYHQFEDKAQQDETYLIGMWSFLVTEVMFFGVLFFIYSLLRWKFTNEWYVVHTLLDVPKGATNTVVLLTSSFTMAIAVHFAQLKMRKQQLMFLGMTALLACVFLVIKFFEYKAKFDHHLVPGYYFEWPPNPEHVHGDAVAMMPLVHGTIAQQFLGLYFTMTGLHGAHVVIGIIVIVGLMVLTIKNRPSVEDFMPTEMVGLYWHFVDLVWIFLFPLFYLIPK